MTSLFSKAPRPVAPPVTRVPTRTDPSVIAAGRKTRSAALSRFGRQGTILTDRINQTIGSSGLKLGA